jgi:hypothetical protein
MHQWDVQKPFSECATEFLDPGLIMRHVHLCQSASLPESDNQLSRLDQNKFTGGAKVPLLSPLSCPPPLINAFKLAAKESYAGA